MHVCRCMSHEPQDDWLDGFLSLRSECRALRDILLPDDLLEGFVSACYEPDDRARHRSSLLLGYKCGTISRMTIPVHKYVLANIDSGRELSPQYRSDLREHWWQEDEEFERHRKSKMFFGRIAELLATEYVEAGGYRVIDSEGFGAAHDLILAGPDGDRAAVEVKYIGDDPDILAITMKSILRGSAAGSVSAYDAANFFLLKLFEAAKQLEACDCKRLAIVVVSANQWNLLECPLRNSWIKWDSLSFLDGSADWRDLLEQKKCEPRFRHVERELPKLVASLSGICVLQLGGDLRLRSVWHS
jgi:hypothetical protein